MGSMVGLVPVAYGFNGGIGSGGIWVQWWDWFRWYMDSMVGLVPVAYGFNGGLGSGGIWVHNDKSINFIILLKIFSIL
jgi:hypothetical protein